MYSGVVSRNGAEAFLKFRWLRRGRSLGRIRVRRGGVGHPEEKEIREISRVLELVRNRRMKRRSVKTNPQVLPLRL